MRIYENKNEPGCYLLRYGTELLLVQYRDFNPQRQKKAINLEEWTEITEPRSNPDQTKSGLFLFSTLCNAEKRTATKRPRGTVASILCWFLQPYHEYISL